jgi:hypothetical protein
VQYAWLLSRYLGHVPGDILDLRLRKVSVLAQIRIERSEQACGRDAERPSFFRAKSDPVMAKAKRLLI